MTFSPSVLAAAQVSAPLRKRARELGTPRNHEEPSPPVVVACASDILGRRRWCPPGEAVTADTRYLILVDVPDPAVPRLVSAFDVRRPELRMHTTRDAGAVRQLLLAQFRAEPWEGIADGYVLADELVLLLGDLSIRSFPLHRIPGLDRTRASGVDAFEVDEDGSFLYWPERDLHLGVSQLLQAVDPAHLAEIEIRRFPGSAAVGAAIAGMREKRGLRQGDIAGVSERQVRRIEQGISRLTGDAARKFAAAFRMELVRFLEQVARAAGAAERSRPEEDEDADAPLRART